MQCPVCTAFRHRLSQESENEAVATLRQRGRVTGGTPGKSFHELESEILISRKRRAHIATELHSHVQEVHGKDLDNSLGLGKVASA
jgi:hypothetical protein